MDNLFDKGSGALTDPFIIRTPDQLSNIRLLKSGYYALGNNINLNVYPYNTGDGWLPIEEFNGVLDGRGYTIDGLYINRPSYTVNCGLFGSITTINTTQIKNLKLTGVNIIGSNDQYNGALIGYLNASTIPLDYMLYNIEINGRISGGFIGSIIGWTNANGTNFKLLSNFLIDTELIAISTTSNRVGSLIAFANTSITCIIEKGIILCKYSGFYNSSVINGYPISGNLDYPRVIDNYVYINSDLWKGLKTASVAYLSNAEITNSLRIPNFNIIPTTLRHNVSVSEPALIMDLLNPVCILADNKTYIFDKISRIWVESSVTDFDFIDRRKFYLNDVKPTEWDFFIGKSDVNVIYFEPVFTKLENTENTITLVKNLDSLTETKVNFNKEIVFENNVEFAFL